MKMKLFSLAVANALLLLAASFVVAQDVPDPMAMSDGAPVADSGYGGKGGKGLLDCCCCDQAGWIFGAEATFMKYHRADGVRWNASPFGETEFDYEVSPRLTAGYINCDGLGARVRYWEYDQTAGDGFSFVSVDTYTIDFEVFQQVELDCCGCTSVEFSAGLRYTAFDEVIYSDFLGVGSANSFDGLGAVVGTEVNRSFGYVDGYARFRYSITMDDKVTFDDIDGRVWMNDSVVAMSEIALGISKSYCLNSGATLTANVGVEWQQWQNFSSNFDTQVTAADIDGHSDVGFFGFVVGAQLVY